MRIGEFAKICNTRISVLRHYDKEWRLSPNYTDSVNQPFVDDKKILGNWRAISWVQNKEEMNFEDKSNEANLFFQWIHFFPEGRCESVYQNGVHLGESAQKWTQGLVLNLLDKTACQYEIVQKNHKEYLFLEWKCGDYIWGGFDPSYYVFVRE